MSIYKRGGIYWYKFMWQSKLIRESTKQGNDKVARQMEAAHRTSLAKGEVGIREKKPVPTLAAFLKDRILPWAEAAFAASVPKTAKWYRNECRVLVAYKPLADAPLDAITGELASEFAAYRLHQGKQIATVNSSLRVLRRVLNLGVEWSVIAVAPKLKVLSGERHRERVVSQDEEARYLAAAPEPLASITTVLADTGTRPEECFRLCWEDVTWLNGRNGALLVTRGKTAAARRVIPMTPRVRAARGRLGLARWHTLRPRRAEQHLRPAPTGAPGWQGAPVRALQPAAHVPDAPGRVWLRCVDAGEDRRAQLRRSLGPLRPSERGCRARRHFAAGWAQFWAQRAEAAF
jgi:integrase